MNYCPTCQRPLNNSVSCPGCGTVVRQSDDLPAPYPGGADGFAGTEPAPATRRLKLHHDLQEAPPMQEPRGYGAPQPVAQPQQPQAPAQPWQPYGDVQSQQQPYVDAQQQPTDYTQYIPAASEWAPQPGSSQTTVLGGPSGYSRGAEANTDSAGYSPAGYSPASHGAAAYNDPSGEYTGAAADPSGGYDAYAQQGSSSRGWLVDDTSGASPSGAYEAGTPGSGAYEVGAPGVAGYGMGANGAADQASIAPTQYLPAAKTPYSAPNGGVPVIAPAGKPARPPAWNKETRYLPEVDAQQGPGAGYAPAGYAQSPGGYPQPSGGYSQPPGGYPQAPGGPGGYGRDDYGADPDEEEARRRNKILIGVVAVPVLAISAFVLVEAFSANNSDVPAGAVAAAGSPSGTASAPATAASSSGAGVIQLPSQTASPSATDPSAAAFTVTASQYTATQGTQTQQTSDIGGGNNVGWISNGSWLEYANVNFGSGVSLVSARIASNASGDNVGVIQFRLDSPTAPPFATIDVNSTGDWQNWTTVQSPIDPMPTGTHTLYVTFSTGLSGNFVNVNWFQFG